MDIPTNKKRRMTRSQSLSDLQKNYESIINYKFIKNPNFKYKQTITRTSNSCGYTELFEVYISHKDLKVYLASKNFDYNIDIYDLLNNKKILSLKGHKYDIENVRYFINKKNYNEYLISADSFVFNNKVIVWDINDNYKIKYKIDTKYNTNIIFSCLLIFPHNSDNDFIITSTANTNIYHKEYSSTKLYSFNNGKFFKNIDGSDNYSVYFLLSWYNKNKIYADIELEKDYEHRYGFISEKNNSEYLYYNSYSGNIVTYDLYKKSIINITALKRYATLNFIQWNEEYFIFSADSEHSFFIIDSHNYKIICQFKDDENSYAKCIKKIYHPKYGESLLILRKNGSIQLWTA